MADELVLYTNPMSRGRIARWMLEEVGQPYRAEILEYSGSMKAPEYLAINPMGKVPTLRHGETIVTEVAAICAYLADVFPEAGLAPPPGSRLRGPYYRWLFFAAGPVEAANTNKALNVVVPPERTGMVGYGSQERALAALEDQLKLSEYIAGELLHRRGRLCRIAHRLGNGVRHDRQAGRVRALLGAGEGPSCRSAGARDRRQARRRAAKSGLRQSGPVGVQTCD